MDQRARPVCNCNRACGSDVTVPSLHRPCHASNAPYPGPGCHHTCPPPPPQCPTNHNRLETSTWLLHGLEEKVCLICAFEPDCGGVDGSPRWAYG